MVLICHSKQTLYIDRRSPSNMVNCGKGNDTAINRRVLKSKLNSVIMDSCSFFCRNDLIIVCALHIMYISYLKIWKPYGNI